MTALVSVLIPMYNEERGIRKTLQSLMHQTFQDFEIIVVDDGSTDESSMVVAEEFPSVRLVHQSNGGIARALNHGLAICSGEFIARIDCNDEAYPIRFEKQVSTMLENPDLGIVGGQVMLYEKDGTDLGVCRYPTTPEKTVRELLRGNPSILHETAMIRKSILDKSGGYDPFYTGREDFELWCRVSLISKITNINELVTRSLSTTDGLSFQGINLSPLIELALMEREERIVRGIAWKNDKLRDKYANRLAKVTGKQLSSKEILENKLILFNRRAAFLLRSGDRRGGITEYRRSLSIGGFHSKSFLGLVGAFLLPTVLFQLMYDLYRWGYSIFLRWKIRRALHETI